MGRPPHLAPPSSAPEYRYPLIDCPYSYFLRVSFFSLEKLVATPLKVDARVCIELDLVKPLLSCVCIGHGGIDFGK